MKILISTGLTFGVVPMPFYSPILIANVMEFIVKANNVTTVQI